MARSQKGSKLFTAHDTGGALSFRNRLINASFNVNQRVYSSGAATSGANQYTLDRWRVVTSGQSLSWTTTDGVITATAPAGGIEQVVEAKNVAIDFYVLNWTGTATALINGSLSIGKGEVFFNVAASDMTIRFSGGTVSQPQLEVDRVSTSFEFRPFGLELMLCQRYFCKTFAYATAPAQNVGIDTGPFNFQVLAASTAAGGRWQFPVTMRATPGTVTLYNPAATNAEIRNRGTSADFSSSSTINASDTGVYVFGTAPAGSSAGNAAAVHITASAEL